MLWLRALEIKLTALPDNSTCNLSEEQYGCELVVRPNTITHLTLDIISEYAEHQSELSGILRPIFQNDFDWESENSMLERIPDIIQTIESMLYHIQLKYFHKCVILCCNILTQVRQP